MTKDILKEMKCILYISMIYGNTYFIVDHLVQKTDPNNIRSVIVDDDDGDISCLMDSFFIMTHFPKKIKVKEINS